MLARHNFVKLIWCQEKGDTSNKTAEFLLRNKIKEQNIPQVHDKMGYNRVKL